MRLTFLAAGLAAVLGLGAHAQTAKPPTGPGQSLLVLDASGSMWGQIGGRAKIEIAREAVADMLANWPASQQLGLMAYGHRRKGDCSDIELLKSPASVDKAGFQQAVNALQPRGMTPISASVRMAAETLKVSERKATVILVSDGEETCHADPCALGQELEKLGVDFTAHVIGFDIDKNPKAKAELQCLASSTGGRYLDAKDAGELSAALKTVTAPPPAKPTLKPPAETEPRLTLYAEENFQGYSQVIGLADIRPPHSDVCIVPSDTTEPLICNMVSHDMASSLRVVGRWKLCEHYDLEGACIEVQRDVADLKQLSRQLSSARYLGTPASASAPAPARSGTTQR